MEQGLMRKKASDSRKASTQEGHNCTFCGKSFVREHSLIRHLCTTKKRFLDQDRQDVRFGFIAYRIFYEIHYRNRKTAITREHFQKSSVYDAFVRFGKYVVDVKAIAPEEFIRYAVQSKLPVDRWCKSDRLYMEYVRNLNKVEDSTRAIERTLLLAESWAHKEGKEIRDFFREIALPLAVQWLMSGRISPWAIFNSESGKELLARLSDEQINLVSTAIDMKFWKKKFLENIDDVHRIQEFLASEGI
jgi:hypothetical protein